MKRAKVLRGERREEWGDVLTSSTVSRLVTIQFADGTVHDINMDWIMVVSSNNDNPTSRLFDGV